ncbi:MAG: hypothetical protein IPL61_33465 [Myxococcales bacterium]|nr:hypothetical protein [Myxococcales bacterium]
MPPTLGFDSSVLSPFARARRLDALERLTDGHRRVVTRAVLGELDRGRADCPALAQVPALPWLEIVAVDTLDELVAFSDFVRALGSSDRNIGEASLLAWAQVASGVAIIDDNAAVSVARSREVTVRRSLGLVADGLNRKQLGGGEARVLVDELIAAGGARYPCDGGGFEAWAERNGLLVPT